MQLKFKNWGATNSPRSFTEKSKTYDLHHSLRIQGLQEVRELTRHIEERAEQRRKSCN